MMLGDEEAVVSILLGTFGLRQHLLVEFSNRSLAMLGIVVLNGQDRDP